MDYVLKIGGSILTDKTEEKKLSEDFEEVLKKLKGQGNGVLVHGAGSFGHPQAERNGLKKGSYEGVLEVHEAVTELNTHILEKLSQIGLEPVPVHTSSIAYRNPETQLHIEKLQGIMQEGFTPVLHGDIVPHKDQGFTIISGDEIVAKIEKKYQTGKAGFCTSEKGVLDENGKVINQISSMDDFKDLGIDGDDVTGGMKGKVKEILDKDIEARIFGREDLEAYFKGEKPGTLVG